MSGGSRRATDLAALMTSRLRCVPPVGSVPDIVQYAAAVVAAAPAAANILTRKLRFTCMERTHYRDGDIVAAVPAASI